MIRPMFRKSLQVVMLSVALVGCKRTPPQSTSVVVLVDLSGSISKETVEFYSGAVTSLVWETLTTRDRLVVLPVDSEAESQSEPIFARDLARIDFSDPRDGFAHKEERERRRVLDYIAVESPKLKQSLMAAVTRRSSNRRGTDLVGALHAATAVFPDDDHSRRILLIFSDMVQESRELNVKQLTRSGDEGGVTLAKTLADRGRIPNLADVSVVIVGAGETGAGVDNAAFFRSLRTFWKTVFVSAGARLDDGDYGYRNQDRIRRLLVRE